MKQRISALDLELLAKELKEQVEGYRLNNIYNIAESKRQFLLKFNKPDNDKLNVVVDCGLRIHLTDFTRNIPQFPSGFVIKLRKHLKSKRLTSLRQVPNDRILVLQFADGLYYLVLEFFSAGNVILLDQDMSILSLQRIVKEHENKVGEKYTMFDQSLFSTQPEELGTSHPPKQYNEEIIRGWFNEEAAKVNSQNLKDLKKKKLIPIQKLILVNAPYLSSDLITKNLKVNDVSPSSSWIDYATKLDLILKIVQDTENEFQKVINLSKDRRGYILAKKNTNYNPERDSPDIEYTYENFHPFEPFCLEKDKENVKIIAIDGPYNLTVDKFFTTIESSKYALKIQSQEEMAKKKITDAQRENQKRIDALADVQTTNEQKGNLIIANTELIETAKYAVQGLIDQQMDWSTIEKLIKTEQAKGNPVAQTIKLPLKLKENSLRVILPLSQDKSDDESDSDSDSSSDSLSDDTDSDSDSDSDDEIKSSKQKKRVKKSKKVKESIVVSINLGMSAYANASEYFSIKKTNAEKQKRVEKNAEKALKNIEERINKQLNKKLKETPDVLKKIRKPYFFEKFFWFFSTEKFLILMGKTGVETDLIYSKYIEDDDIYMTNSFGTQVWIKNFEKTEVPPNTLMQAGIFCMSASEAWSKKIAASPIWCKAKNISKFHSGNKDILDSGKFRIINENENNTLPPAQLVMGLGFLWKVKTDLPASEDENDEKEDEDEGEVDEENDNTPIEKTDIVKEGQSQLSIDKNQIEEEEKVQQIDEDKNESEITESSDISTPIVQQMKKNVRGKKGKLKKMQKKYADQDEEERLLRLEALGTLKGIEKKQREQQEEEQRQQTREYKKVQRERQKQRQHLTFTKNEKVKIHPTRFLTELKPTLDKDDEVVDIVPVFAPWPALLKYKYKIKVQPGSGKKTKTINEITRHFLSRKIDTTNSDKEIDWSIEHEMIKSLKDQDLVLSVCVDKLKVTIPGANNKNGKGSSNGKQQPKKKGKKKN